MDRPEHHRPSGFRPARRSGKAGRHRKARRPGRREQGSGIVREGHRAGRRGRGRFQKSQELSRPDWQDRDLSGRRRQRSQDEAGGEPLPRAGCGVVSESMALAQKLGLEERAYVDTINQTAHRNYFTEDKGPKIVARDLSRHSRLTTFSRT